MIVVAFNSSLQERSLRGGCLAPPNEQILLLYAVLQSLRVAERGGDIRAKTLRFRTQKIMLHRNRLWLVVGPRRRPRLRCPTGCRCCRH
jgi:hypothetical protein